MNGMRVCMLWWVGVVCVDGLTQNVGGRWGGAITAATFLKEFVDKASWAHIGAQRADTPTLTKGRKEASDLHDGRPTTMFVHVLAALVGLSAP